MAWQFPNTTNYLRKTVSGLAVVPPFSLAIWDYRTDAATDFPVCLAMWRSANATGEYTHLFTGGSGHLRCPGFEYKNPTNDPIIYSATGPPINTWNHFAATISSGFNANLYLNGAFTANGAFSPSGMAGMDTLSVAGLSNAFARNDGLIYGAWWKVDLTAADIAALALGFSPRQIQPSKLIDCCLVLGNSSAIVRSLNAAPFTQTGTVSTQVPSPRLRL